MNLTYLNKNNNILRICQHIMLGIFVMTLSSCAHFTKHKDSKADDRPPISTLKGSTLGEQVKRGPKVYRGDYSSQLTTSPVAQTNVEQAASDLGYVPQIATIENDTSGSGQSRAPRFGTKTIDAYVAPLPLPQFVDAVFGEMLKTPYVIGPTVVKRQDIVQLRSSGKMKSRDFFSLITEALEEYGVRVVPENGTYKVIEDKSLRARIPQFIKSRARPSTPNNLRPVIQFVELRALDSSSMISLLQQAFGRKNDKLTIRANPRENYISLAGLPVDVDAAVKIIRELDELNYAGVQVNRYTPRYWNVAELKETLTNVLRTEGWQVSDNINQVRTIALMPVEYSNDLFIFAKTRQAHRRIDKWIAELDRPIEGGDTEQFFIYQVKNVDATILAETANSVLFSSGGPISGPTAGPTQGGQGPGGIGNISSQAFFTVDPVGNKIIFTGTAKDYDRLVNLLTQLDTPAPEVFIEVKIAEVTLTDNKSFGVEFFIDDLGNDSVQLTTQSGGLGIGSSGLNIGLLSGNVDASINAFASNRKVKVLSTPTLMARSGSSAQIQVGNDVPVITSQRAANNQSGDGSTDILQNIDYRKTGVLLSIEPIVFSDDRIDLTISQEVSSTLSVENSSISSPTISNRSLSTQLSLQDGQTAVMGGLIQEDFVKDERGIPLLKDLPVVGQAFSVDGTTITRTELVVLITAYVLRGQEDRANFVRHITNRMDSQLQDGGGLVTLMPKTP